MSADRLPVCFNKQQVSMEITSTKIRGSNYCNFDNNYPDVVSFDNSTTQQHIHKYFLKYEYMSD